MYYAVLSIIIAVLSAVGIYFCVKIIRQITKFHKGYGGGIKDWDCSDWGIIVSLGALNVINLINLIDYMIKAIKE